jgi:hypothetical protein
MGNRLIDLTGQRFGRLTIIKQVPYKNNHAARWLCVCDCGNEIEVFSSNLRNGNVKSCKCLQNEMYENQKLYNEYDLSGEFGIGFTQKGEPFYFDLDDYEKIKDHCWHIGKYDGYVVTNIPGASTLLKIHKLITGTDESIKTDHINRKRYDNRKSNLRKVTNGENAINKSISKRNTSGIMGISWCKERNNWETYITLNRKRKNLGRFENLLDAIIIRLKAELEYFGVDFAPQRHLFAEYGII